MAGFNSKAVVMKIALIGYGKMGQMLHKHAPDYQLNVEAIIDPHSPHATARSISKEALFSIDLCIDFSTPQSALNNIQKLAKLKKNIVVGTTGLHQDFDTIKKIVEDEQTGILYASNFSIGIYLFKKIVAKSAELFSPLGNYQFQIDEKHHQHKKDMPSGTALDLAKILQQKQTTPQKVAVNPVNRLNQELPIYCTRTQDIIGEHTVTFDSLLDTIELKHHSKSRTSYASGALQAARWLSNKQGFYTLEDMMKSLEVSA